MKAAAEYVEKTFRNYGYEQTVTEQFPLTGWRFGSMIFADMDNGCCEGPGALPCMFSQSVNVSGVPVWLDSKVLGNLKKEDVESLRLLDGNRPIPVSTSWVHSDYPEILFADLGENPVLPDPMDTVLEVRLKG